MIEVVVEVVKVFADFVAGVQWPCLVVGFVEFFAKAAEHFGEGDVGFSVSVVGGGVEDDGVAFGIKVHVAAPEVSVEEGGLGGVVGEEFANLFEEFFLSGKGFAGALGEVELVAKAMVAVEFGPGVGKWVFLWCGADDVLVLPAVLFGGVFVEVGELLAGFGVASWFWGAEFDVFQHEEGVALGDSVGNGLGDSDGLGLFEFFECFGFYREDFSKCGGIEFYEPCPGGGLEAFGLVDAAASKGAFLYQFLGFAGGFGNGVADVYHGFLNWLFAEGLGRFLK